MALPAHDTSSQATPDLTGSALPARAARAVVLMAGDVMALVLAAAAGYFLWAGPVRNISPALYLELAPLALIFVAGYAQAGLYPGFGLGPVETLRRLTYVTAFGFLVLAAIAFALKLPPVYSRVSFALALTGALVLVPIARLVVYRIAGRAGWWREPVVIIGAGDRAARAAQSLNASAHAGYRPVAAVTPDQAAAFARGGVRVALLDVGQAQDIALLDRLQQHFRHVVLLRGQEHLPIEGLHVRNMGGLVGIEYTNNLLMRENRVVKRSLDIVLAALALIVFSPVMLVAAVLVRLIDGGPALYFQDRAGRDGRRIAVPKIRTMRIDAEQRLAGHLAVNPVMKDEWKRRYKIRNDPRLIPVIGRQFRRFSIDELPQLWTVLAGHMSLVGPRPFPDYHVARFSDGFVALRQRVQPGITGLWQVTVRSEGSIEDQEAWDSYYIRNWSVWLDLYILMRTLATVASGRGAY